ncbi:hypothetical protein SGGMMB4_02596 [Sodalis glossinidius str. 'morsitans']|uniref:Uncharacterized protein n=1 Tax=Sodalis glossinidius (strain morsitans) TaxID=343509 RepID=A0A193QIR8_SODGM|nr:hypothetical protein SGGMMB4_02596 [Sodalis glossinidius str. 'morsitans']
MSRNYNQTRVVHNGLEKWESIHNGLTVSRNHEGLIVIEASEMGIAHVKFELTNEQSDELVEILAQA